MMPVTELLILQHVRLNIPLSQVISRPGRKAICAICGEEIINGREVSNNTVVLCRACAGESYYHFSASPQMPEEVILPGSHAELDIATTHP
jgi:formylmethanofuran dehydrogenase subunit E